MDNKNLIIGLILICCICLILGIFNSFNKIKIANSQNNYKAASTNITKVRGKNKIAYIKLNGIIQSEDREKFFITNNTNSINALEALNQARTDTSVKGVVLKINTPGGTVAMSQNIYDAIIKLRKTKPIVVFMDDVAASGGYYIACASDRIVCQSGTITGSIGVIFSTLDIHKLMENKLQVNANVIKSGKYKDIGSGYKEMSKEERELIQNIVDDSYNQFLKAIIQGRIQRNDSYKAPVTSLDVDTLNKYADGRIFTGLQAKTLGFVDFNGDIDLAYKICKNMAQEKFNLKNKNLPLEPYYVKQNINFTDFVFNISQKLNMGFNIDSLIPNSVKLSHRPLYLWE